MTKSKSLPISKGMVWESYQQVKVKRGGAGIDRESIEQFDADLSKNLYKIWNRLASGSYFPPAVRTVFIPKKQGGKRPLGIPTVSDRIAQGVVKAYLEPGIDVKFHHSSFGYRGSKSAHDAVLQCQNNCRRYEWVLDVDIKGFFDNINHEVMLQLVGLHSREKWVLMYVERWLKAGVEQEDGSIAARTKGTPQGGVISPLLANIYLHHAVDEWLTAMYPNCPFERYADDMVVHCASQQQAEELQQVLQERLTAFSLELHPEKTKIVYCKDYRRNGKHDKMSFTFLGFSFQPRTAKSQREGRFLTFRPAISQQARTHIRDSIRKVIIPRWSEASLEWFAQNLNVKIRGWINYYCKIEKWGISNVFAYTNQLLMKWIKNKYRLQSKKQVYQKWRALQAQQPNLFHHWNFGIRGC